MEDASALDRWPLAQVFREWGRFEPGDHSEGRRASVVVQRLVRVDAPDETV
jgi:hypothetical protein